MILKSNSFNFPFRLLAIISFIIGLLGFIYSKNYWTIIMIAFGLLPFWVFKGIELTKDKKYIIYFKLYGFAYKSTFKSVTIPTDLKNIYLQKRNYSIRYLTSKTDRLSYKTQTDYRIYLVNNENQKELIITFIDYYEGFKVAKYLSDKLNCSLFENEKNDNAIEEEDNDFYTKTNHDRTNDLKMIRELSKNKK